MCFVSLSVGITIAYLGVVQAKCERQAKNFKIPNFRLALNSYIHLENVLTLTWVQTIHYDFEIIVILRNVVNSQLFS